MATVVPSSLTPRPRVGIIGTRKVAGRRSKRVCKLRSAVLRLVHPVSDTPLGVEVPFVGFGGVVVFCHDEHGKGEKRKRGEVAGL